MKRNHKLPGFYAQVTAIYTLTLFTCLKTTNQNEEGD